MIEKIKKSYKYEINQETDKFIASFKYNVKKKDFIKTLKGRKFDWDRKAWIIDATNENLSKLSKSGLFSINPECTPITTTAEQIKPPENEKTTIMKDNKILLSFSGDNFRNTLGFVKTLAGRKYSDKKWHVPFTLNNYKKLVDFEFDIDDSIRKKYFHEINFDDPGIKEISGLKGIPYNFQWDAFNFIESHAGKCMLAMDMGLGKTLVSLMYCQHHLEKRPVVIVCPATLKLNWKSEIEKWLGEKKIQVLSGLPNENNQLDPEAEFYIVNYDIIRNIHKKNVEIKHSGWINYFNKVEILIIDESHKIGNSQTYQSKAVRELCDIAKHIIPLTGTPFRNSADELWSILNKVKPSVASTRYDFRFRYCNPRHNGFGWQYNGISNAKELNEYLNYCMIRMKKTDVLKDLPQKTIQIMPIELESSDMAKYKAEIRGIVDNISKYDNKKKKACIFRLRRILGDAKAKVVKKWLTDFFDNNNEKFVMFAHHKKAISELMKSHKNSVKIDGDIDVKKRQNIVEEFQNNGDIKLFVGGISAAGVGITLTSACYGGFTELPFVPADFDQCCDRLVRIGQERPVTIYVFVAKGTLDEYLCEIIDYKREITEKIIDGKFKESDIIESLIQKLIEGEK